MSRVLVLLFLLLVGATTSPLARADGSSCDGDYKEGSEMFFTQCMGHPGCLLVLGIMKSCEAGKQFLSALSSSGNSKALTDDEVSRAYTQYKGDTVGLGDCVFKLNAAACKAALGTGEAVGSSAEPPRAPARTINSLAQAEAKREEIQRKDRELANNLVEICRSAMQAQTCQGRLLAIENLRDDVARWNQNAELMDFVPPIMLDSPDLISQTGWERGAGAGAWYDRAGNRLDGECSELVVVINGLVTNAPERARERLPEFKPCAERNPGLAQWFPRWEAQLAGGAAAASGVGNTGTLVAGPYAKPKDCERLQKQIAASIQAHPKKEPTELSFFEAECLPQSPDYKVQVATWRQGFRAVSSQFEAAAVTSGESKAAQGQQVASLDQWNSQVVAKEQKLIFPSQLGTVSEADCVSEQDRSRFIYARYKEEYQKQYGHANDLPDGHDDFMESSRAFGKNGPLRYACAEDEDAGVDMAACAETYVDGFRSFFKLVREYANGPMTCNDEVSCGRAAFAARNKLELCLAELEWERGWELQRK